MSRTEEPAEAPGEETARSLDAADPLAYARTLFLIPEGVTYLDGNSLGALGVRVPARVSDAVHRQWGEHLIRAWNDDGWWAAPLRVGDRVGRLIGAAPGQTVVGESTSVQIFNALVGAARLRPGRDVLITDADQFPTDRYLAASVGRLLGLTVVERPVAELDETLSECSGRTAVVALDAVDYRTGELRDIAGVTAAVRRAGAVVVWDLCHAVGAVPLYMDGHGVDVAVGCTYKYLSGGPGAPAFCYLAARHQTAFDAPLTGWHGHARPFDAAAGFEPAAGIARARIGTPHVLSLLALDAALDVFDEIGIAAVREKNRSLGEFFLSCVDALPAELGFEVVTPRDPDRRGSHITLRHPHAHPVMAALIGRGVIGDVRPPNLLRFGFNALYVSYADIHRAVAALGEVAASGEFRHDRYQSRQPVP